MHADFAILELGTVSKKKKVDALVRFFFLLTFAAAIPAIVSGGIAGAIFVRPFTLTRNRWMIDDVLGVRPLHGLCGAWGGVGIAPNGSGRCSAWPGRWPAASSSTAR